MRNRHNPNAHNNPYYNYPWHDIYRTYHTGHFPRQEYPEVDPSLFKESAEAFREILYDASGILQRLSESEDFAFQVMDAAQKDDVERVRQLLESTGIHNKVEVDYNPDGIKMTMQTEVEGADCCHLTMDLRW
ncbi:hypothetical protein [Piscibacillus halophilus]|uniref:Uncharacterized protein n=1 Tax=Piscibacillus halophilus TaxID=571933 RepID=A0A1H9GPC0_9BACI|nr:hypothetical protein [Piscibacillus halophilus]SEQ51890.1 hypothetical protein SAMN05216362_11617 [Piscibacillus halophilus]